MKTKFKKRTKPASRGLRFESLEDRVPLAGDVTAALSAAGTLTIKGDVHENHIAIVENGAGQIVITGSNNTTITANGQTGAQAVFNVGAGGLKNVSINTANALTAQGDVRGKFGADVVSITGLNVSGNLSVSGAHGGVLTVADANIKGSTKVKFGAGVSSINAGASVGSVVSLGAGLSNTLGVGVGAKRADVSISTGGNNDHITVAANVVGRNLSVKAGAGDDSVNLGVTGALKVGGRLSVDAGTGNDAVVSANVDIGSTTSIKAGAGIDVVKLGSAQANVATTFKNNFSVSLGGGAKDSLIVQGKLNSVSSSSASASTTFAKNLTVAGGAGVDSVGFNGAAVNGNLKVSTGAAHDAVLAANLAVLGNASVSAGAGDDVVALSAVPSALRTTVRGNTSVSLGAGNNRLTVKGADLNGNVKLTAGAGADRIAASQASFGSKVSVSGGAGANVLAFDTASLQTAANAAIKISGGANLSGAALATALAESVTAVQTASVDAALDGLFV